jgi:zinc D-Ala-D-Ala carboxypeptidase
MIYAHHSLMPWDESRWPNFSPLEIACRREGEAYLDHVFLDVLQKLRRLIGKPIRLNSAHRSRVHNRMVGGALNSEHLRIAVDISLHNHDPANLIGAAKNAGFTTFGFYKTFLHCDLRPGRRWTTKGGRETWKHLANS